MAETSNYRRNFIIKKVITVNVNNKGLVEALTSVGVQVPVEALTSVGAQPSAGVQVPVGAQASVGTQASSVAAQDHAAALDPAEALISAGAHLSAAATRDSVAAAQNPAVADQGNVEADQNPAVAVQGIIEATQAPVAAKNKDRRKAKRGTDAEALVPAPLEDSHSKLYGYIRVYTREQNEARQVDDLQSYGVDEVFMDKQSGKDFNRPAYQNLLTKLQPGDVLVVKSIDRLGWDYSEILDQWRIITKEKQAAIVVVDMPLLDTRSNRDVTGTLIADIVLQLLSYVAETERSFIRQRQREGIAAAKARGQRFGRPSMEVDPRAAELAEKWGRQQIGSREKVNQIYNCGRPMARDLIPRGHIV